VTGAAGFIGSHLIDLLLCERHEVRAVDNFDDYYSGKMQFLVQHEKNPDFELIKADILDLERMRRTVKGADVVVHLAAQAGVRFSVANPLKSHTVNALGTLNLLVACRDSGVRRLVNSSSSSVYGNAKRLPVKEDDPLEPVSPYAASKMIAEVYCRQFNELYGLETISLRYFTVYGPRQRPDMAIRIFTDRVLRNQKPQIFGDGEQTRDFTFISDVVPAINASIDCGNAEGISLNICSGRRLTVNRLVSNILQICDREDIEPEYLPEQPGDVEHTWGDNSLARRILDWEPKVDIEEGLQRFVEWYRQVIRPI
jgi:UDP-glucose 4-epimerase